MKKNIQKNINKLKTKLQENKININNIIYSLQSLQDDREIGFYSLLFPYLEFQEAATPFIASVYFNQKIGKFIILYNPYLLGILNNREIIAILKHEFAHIFLEHVRNRFDEKKDHNITNIAMDILINGYRKKPFIKNIPGSGEKGEKHPFSGIFIEDIEKEYGISINPNKDTYEDVYNKIIKSKEYKRKQKENSNSNKNSNCSISNGPTLNNFPDNSQYEENLEDINQKIKEVIKKIQEKENILDKTLKNDHSYNEEQLDAAIKSILEMSPIERLIEQHKISDEMEKKETVNDSTLDLNKKEILKNTLEKAKSRGLLSSSLEEIYIKLTNDLKPKINWKTVLRKIIVKNDDLLSSNLEYTFMRPHLSIEDPNVMGHMQEKEVKIGVVLDVSGSMSNSDLINALKEIKGLLKDQEEIELVQVDTEIKSIQKIRKYDLVKGIERKGIGGTILGPGIKYFFEKGIFTIIILTDGEIEKHFDFKIPDIATLIFVLPENGNLNLDTNSLKNKPIILKI